MLEKKKERKNIYIYIIDWTIAFDNLSNIIKDMFAWLILRGNTPRRPQCCSGSVSEPEMKKQMLTVIWHL